MLDSSPWTFFVIESEHKGRVPINYTYVFTDMTFTHEGNKTFIDNMVNFEKMVSFCTQRRIHFKDVFHVPFCSSLKSDVVSKEPLILISPAYYS